MGIDLAEDDIAIRCNLVTLSDESRYEDTTMVDYSSDEITTAEAGELIRFLDQKLGTDQVHFYPSIKSRWICILLRRTIYPAKKSLPFFQREKPPRCFMTL